MLLLLLCPLLSGRPLLLRGPLLRRLLGARLGGLLLCRALLRLLSDALLCLLLSGLLLGRALLGGLLGTLGLLLNSPLLRSLLERRALLRCLLSPLPRRLVLLLQELLTPLLRADLGGGLLACPRSGRSGRLTLL